RTPTTNSTFFPYTTLFRSKKEDGGTRVDVKMTLTAPGCGMGPAIAHDAQSKLLSIDGVDEADVQLVWDPPWNQNMISDAGRMKLDRKSTRLNSSHRTISYA